jgi:hypothetical protein
LRFSQDIHSTSKNIGEKKDAVDKKARFQKHEKYHASECENHLCEDISERVARI